MIHFGRYQLDPVQGLTRGGQEVRLTPKSLCVLCLLAERAGHVVTKEELFRTVWPDTAVTDSALTSCIKELRHALHDDAHHPRFIETRHRRGYRFLVQTSSAPVPKVSSESRHDSPVSAPAGRTDTPLVGREAVLEQMLGACALAERGARQVLFVTGEPGIGKTTVVQALLAKAAAGSAVRTTWAQCIEHYGAGEPYQPLLEALTRLWRQPGGGELVSILERYAPTWLAQLPALLEPARLAALQRTAAGTTRNRMLRELIDAIEVITARVPLIVWLEDLHWSDASTLDWIATLAQRPEPAQLVLIGTFRRPAVDGAGGPIAAMVDALRVKGFSREIPLGALDEAAVADYAALRFPPAPDHEEASRGLARLVHQHTGGNPLFVVNVLGDLVGRGALVEWGGHWTIRSDLHAADLGIPEDVRRMLERQVDRVPPGERALLEIASVAGAPFSAATVAASSGLALNDVEEILAGLARQRRFVQETGAVEWPDGTIAARFDFLHVLYRDVLYQRVPAGRRAELHRAIGACQEAAYGERATEIAAGLAMHFEKGRDTRRAVIYFHHAAENARRLSAYKEARMHFDRALALLESEAAGPERTEQEVVLRTGLGGVIMATRGWGAPEAEDAYSRARALCRELGETPRLFPALWGLWLFYLGRGPLSTASDFAQDLVAMARRSEDRGLLLQAHHASWATAFLRGDLEAAREAASEGARLYEPGQHAAMAATYGNHDAGVCGRMFMARALTLLGRTDEAVRATEEAIALARDLGHPLSLTLALVFAAADDQARRDGRAASTHAGAAAAIARDQDFRLMLAWALTFEGWAAVEQGQEHGLERIDDGVAEARATGSEQFLPHLLGLLAETHLRGRRADAGLQVLDEALAIVQRTGERFYEAELHRLTGELHLVANAPRATHHAEEAFLHALDIARSQGAKLFQLRAAVSLGRLWERLGRGAEALTLVAGARQDIMAGVTLPDVIDADALLAG